MVLKLKPMTGLEPATTCLKGTRSTKLSYISYNQKMIIAYKIFSMPGIEPGSAA